MAGKFVTFIGLLALTSSCMAGVTTYAHNPFFKSFAAAPVVAAPVVKSVAAPNIFVNSAPVVATAPAALLKTNEADPHPQYDFSYGVHDSITGDIKNQVESRDGGNVAGSYSVVDADGFQRTVTYTADDANGFNAVVHRKPIAGKAVVASPVVHAAPIVKTYAAATPVVQAASVVQAAPVIKTYAAAPIFHTTPVVKTYASAPLIHAAPVVKTYTSSPLVHSAPVVNTYAAAPFIHSAPVYKSYAAAPVVQSSPVYTTYAAAPVIQSAPLFKSYANAPVVHSTPYFQSTPVFQQYHQFSSPPQQFTYISSPVSVAEQPQSHEVTTEIQNHDGQQPQQSPEQPQQAPERTQQSSQQPQQATAQPENEPTPIEYPQQQGEQQQQNQQPLAQHQFVQQQQQQQQQFLTQQIFPPYPQYEIPQQQFQIGQQQHQQNNGDSDVVEARLVPTKDQQPSKVYLASEQKSEGKSEDITETEVNPVSVASINTANAVPAHVAENQKESAKDMKKKSD